MLPTRLLRAFFFTVFIIFLIIYLEVRLHPLHHLSASHSIPTGPIPLFNRQGIPSPTLRPSIYQAQYLHNNPKIRTSFKEGFYVASLQGVPGAHSSNDHRLDQFIQHFQNICPDITFHICPGVNEKNRPGYGIAKTWAQCIDHALKQDDVDVAYFFEDDARFQEHLTTAAANTTQFCKPKFRERLWRAAPSDTYLLLFGGHHFSYGSGHVFDGNPNVLGGGTFYEIDNSWGSYAWAVPGQLNLKSLKNGFLKDIHHGKIVLSKDGAEMISPDETKHKHGIAIGKRSYVLAPLMFVHPSGFSNTWGLKLSNNGIMNDGHPPFLIRYKRTLLTTMLLVIIVVLVVGVVVRGFGWRRKISY